MSDRVGWLVFLVVVVAIAGVGSATVAGSTAPESESVFAQQADVYADEVRMDVAVRSDGDADWTLEFLVRLDDDERTEAFESLEADVADDPGAYTAEFAARMDDTVAAASEATGREMTADGFAVETERQSFAREYGVVRYSFRWHGFAAGEGDDLHAGDVIQGLYLDDGTRVLLSWPEEYELESVAPEPDDRRDHAVIWYGSETDFVSGEPRVVVSPGGAGLGWAVAGGVAAAVGIVGAVGWWLRRRTAEAAGAADGDDPQPTPEPEAPSPTTEPEESLLSNEEQVLRLLEERGGRIKQQTIVDELGWTDAKTSKVVGGLREEGNLESFRLGRENVLTLPEDDTASQSAVDGKSKSG
ncbi:helix-turn-helix transcriptional regulator [Natronobeatus ordinarius]|uniref:helix-turn-helix transcriptional regulator n=1 Tax=Natronobeatus ordinarius TaxID=2963433 RepID=UPI0020CC07C6|nr:hypothetical protein [Natronobeatus ordinarius]